MTEPKRRLQTDASSQDAKNDSSNATDQSPAKANVQVAATALGGRDFEGQVTKEINGKTYILIGNEQQLRAIGSGKKVIGRINKVTQTCTRTRTPQLSVGGRHAVLRIRR